MSMFLRAVCCFVLFCATSISALAQLSTASAAGNVTDSMGAEIPGATIVFTQTQTNFTRTTKTNGQGEYRAEFLPVGPYTVRVDAPGFKGDRADRHRASRDPAGNLELLASARYTDCRC